MAWWLHDLEQNRLDGFHIHMITRVHLKDPGCNVGEHKHVWGLDLEFDDAVFDNIGSMTSRRDGILTISIHVCLCRELTGSGRMMGSFYSFEKGVCIYDFMLFQVRSGSSRIFI
ncbi:hypothetical protein V6N13_095315 [Hibiscus sabdariffa]|uniref:Uncharacterized protein n=1 Tax=Hibiscus sabdariffa TaxID=183260 RepID=A0ABR2PS02_9ROSI